MTSVAIDYKKIATKYNLSRGWKKIKTLVEKKNLHGLYLYELHALSDYLCITLSHRENMKQWRHEEEGKRRTVPKISRYVSPSPPKPFDLQLSDPLLRQTRAITPDVSNRRHLVPRPKSSTPLRARSPDFKKFEDDSEKQNNACHKCSGCPRDGLVEHISKIIYATNSTKPKIDIPLVSIEPTPEAKNLKATINRVLTMVNIAKSLSPSDDKVQQLEQEKEEKKVEPMIETPKLTPRSNKSTARIPREKSGATVLKGVKLQLSIDLPVQVSYETDKLLKMKPRRTIHTIMSETFNTPELSFEIRPFSPVHNIKRALSQRMHVPEYDFDLYYKNTKIHEGEEITPESLGMNDQDKIEIVKRVIES
jgi:hypothetical protein